MLIPLTCFLAALSLALAAVAMAAPSITEYPVTTKDLAPTGIALGPDANIWFTEYQANGGIGRITTGGTITEFTTGLTAKSQPDGIAAGPDGNIWFTEAANPERIGRITPEGTITEFTTGLTSNGQPTGITQGPDGNLWFTEAANPGRIGRITPSGTITEYTTSLTSNSQPDQIAAGPDGNLWFTQPGGSGAIGRITPEGVITEFTTGLTTNSKPTGIAVGPDGNLWFTEAGGTARIGRITVGGAITEFSSGLTANSRPESIAAGNDGAMYFSENANPGRIGRITMSGAITETATTTTNSEPAQITTGGNGNLWFTEIGNHGQIGTLTVAPGVSAGSPTATERRAVLKALVNPDSQASTFVFEYGTSSAYGTTTASGSAGSGSSLAAVSKAVSGLEPNTTYHYRVVATNASGTTYGPDQTVLTGEPPTATTAAATGVTLTSATLNGVVSPRGTATSYVFEWGTASSYEHQAPVEAVELGANNGLHEVAQTIEGLTPDTHYHFRVRASNCSGCEEGTIYGSDQVFTTAAPPSATTEAATAISQTSATLNGFVDPKSAETVYHFDWGETAAFGQQTPAFTLSAADGAKAVAASLSSLLAGHVYHYRLVATNCEGCEAGTTYGAEMVLATEAAPVETSPLSPLPGTPEPTPVPVPTPGATVAPPALGHTALLKVSSGTVTIRFADGSTLPLSGPADIPIGATVDTRRGKLEMSTALNARGAAETVTVWGGIFTVGQSVSGLTTMTIPVATGCTRPKAKGAAFAARGHAKKPEPKKPETLWAHDNHGSYSTRGHNSVATVRGTIWGTTESCEGTRTTVRQGLVSVKPRHRRAVLIHAGHSYLARR